LKIPWGESLVRVRFPSPALEIPLNNRLNCGWAEAAFHFSEPKTPAKRQIPLPPAKKQEEITDKIFSFREQANAPRAQAAEASAGARKQAERAVME
ncbi:MAG TPA: hypothetical protein PKV64_10180, partial [Candidatus Aminicenantes bacterium]|nr:hypothetical protein [Candidatus Aminicenantes bacterium]